MADNAYDPLTNPIDVIRLAGKDSPGLATVVIKTGSPRKWDERAGYGVAGSALVYMGRRLAHFDVELRLYTSEHWRDWAAWKVLVDRPPYGKLPRALDISHPWLAMHDIKAAVVEDVVGPVPIDNGGQLITISFIEWRKLTPSPPLKPEAAKPPAAIDPVDKVIENLSKQVEELAK